MWLYHHGRLTVCFPYKKIIHSEFPIPPAFGILQKYPCCKEHHKSVNQNLCQTILISRVCYSNNWKLDLHVELMLKPKHCRGVLISIRSVLNTIFCIWHSAEYPCWVVCNQNVISHTWKASSFMSCEELVHEYPFFQWFTSPSYACFLNKKKACSCFEV